MTTDNRQTLPLEAIAADLAEARSEWRSRHSGARGQGFPSRRKLELIVINLAGALFPQRLGPNMAKIDDEPAYVLETLARALQGLREQVTLELAIAEDAATRAVSIIHAFGLALPALRRILDTDVEAAFVGDPAARSVDEILLCYPGIVAILHHRVAHQLHLLGAPLVARIIAEIAHAQTGIDIHPAAKIGPCFFIDHGTGVVIGETTIVGKRVRIYQAVTLGARSFPVEEDGSLTKGVARHPILEDDVTIYSGATILGRVTIGAGAVIGGNVWLTQSVPAGSVIHQAHAEREYVHASALPSGHIGSDPER